MLPDDPASGEAAADDTTQSRDFEAEARENGWKPEAEFKGRKEHWKDAETFIHDREENLHVMKGMLDKQGKEYADRLERIERNAEIAINAAKKASAQEIAYWQGQARAAVANKDVAAYDAATAAIEEAKKQAPRVEAPVRSERDDADAKFEADNPWYGKDKTMTAFARGVSVELLDEDPSMSIAENRRKVADAVREQFPQKFSQERTRFAAVDSGSAFPSAGRKNAPKGYDSLPPEVKQAADKYVAKGWFKTGDEYAKDYYSEIEKDRSRRA